MMGSNDKLQAILRTNFSIGVIGNNIILQCKKSLCLFKPCFVCHLTTLQILTVVIA